MEEIKAGEYIRTESGNIYQIRKIEKSISTIGQTIYWVKEFYLLKEDIKSHSKNIIDLIEEGDIVNGCVVITEKYTYIEMNFINTDSEVSYGWGTGAIPESEIKTILTHEMYKQNCYKVGEENE